MTKRWSPEERQRARAMLEAASPSPQAAPAYDKDGREIPPVTLATMREQEKGRLLGRPLASCTPASGSFNPQTRT